MFCFDLCFPKATEAVNSKMTVWRSSELIGYVDLTIFREIWKHSLIDKDQKDVGFTKNGARRNFFLEDTREGLE